MDLVKYDIEGNDEAQEMFQLAIDSCFRMTDMINILLTQAKSEQGLEMKMLDINEVLSNVTIDLRLLIENNKAKIESSKLPSLKGASGLIRSVFQNLITNALKYKHPERTPVLYIDSFEEDDFWRFEFKDNGVGIKQEFLDKLFELFNRGDQEKSDIDGLGIGLANCKKFIELHGGEISIESTFGEGTTVSFTLAK